MDAGRTTVPRQNLPGDRRRWNYRETDSLGGVDPYSSSKACAELVVSSYRRSYFGDLPIFVATVRAGNVIGGESAATRIVGCNQRFVETTGWMPSISLDEGIRQMIDALIGPDRRDSGACGVDSVLHGFSNSV